MIPGANASDCGTAIPPQEGLTMKKTRGTAGIDELIGSNKDDFILGLDGDDVVKGAGGDDTLKGGAGFDYVLGGNGNDKIFGDDDNDYLFGEGGHDIVKGGDGNDIIVGAAGSDTLLGDAGNDRMFSITGDDNMMGGEGDDFYGIGGDTVTALDTLGNDEYKVTAGGTAAIEDRSDDDTLRIADNDGGRTLTIDDFLFQRSGDDLVITIDGYEGQTVVTFFYAEADYRIERLHDEDPDARTGFDLEIEAVLELADGDSPIRGTDIWDV